MILAHLPSGYLFGRAAGGRDRAVLIAALIGSVAPDFDMFWFHLVDQGQTHHHRFWPHIPMIWAGIAALVGCLVLGKRIGFGRENMAPHSMTLTMVGASILWVGWFGFNAGSNLEANGIAALVLPLIALTARRWLAPAAAFLGAVMLHLVLDTLNGGILWLWPFSDRLITLVTVPATHSHWVLSFLTHWSVLAEIAIILAAAALLLRDRLAARASRRRIG
jgi:hypothetical protein